MIDFTNLGVGISLVLVGVVIIFVGNYYSKIIGILEHNIFSKQIFL